MLLQMIQVMLDNLDNLVSLECAVQYDFPPSPRAGSGIREKMCVTGRCDGEKVLLTSGANNKIKVG